MARMVLIFEDADNDHVDVEVDYGEWSGECEEATPAVKIASILYALATTKNANQLFDFAKEEVAGNMTEADACRIAGRVGEHPEAERLLREYRAIIGERFDSAESLDEADGYLAVLRRIDAVLEE